MGSRDQPHLYSHKPSSELPFSADNTLQMTTMEDSSGQLHCRHSIRRVNRIGILSFSVDLIGHQFNLDLETMMF